MSGMPSFSVVINTFNRADALEQALSGLRFLDYPSYEVIVVNGPSTDGTEAVLARWGDAIKIGRCDAPNLSVSRNIGVSLAAGEIVAFIDDDAVPHPQWLTELARGYADPRVAGVGGFTIDNTGVRYQAGKTLCDRFGNAFHVSPFFDERPLNRPGTAHYPSLLGTNSSFRRRALLEIGGFDHSFAYLLDETDVCLRLVDAGYEIHYAPQAIVYHRYAPSHLRTVKRVPRSLYPSCVSKSYFIMRHGAAVDLGEAARQLDAYQAMLHASNRWHADHGNVTHEHAAKLDHEVVSGVAAGRTRGMENVARRVGDLVPAAEAPALHPFPCGGGLTIAMVSQGFPPDNEAGIARWTAMMAEGLSRRGHQVHVIAKAEGLPSSEFRDGFWLHRIRPETGTASAGWQDLPPNIAEWAEAVRLKIEALRSFGLQLASFPIWDLEGLALAEAGTLPVVMSLHTTYALAAPFKPEWQLRLIYRHRMVDVMIRREKEALEKLPILLANSRSVIADVESSYGVRLGGRAVLAPHGTYDPFEDKPSRRSLRDGVARPFTVAFVGRFEPRKGFDLALSAILRLLDEHEQAVAVIAGDELHSQVRTAIAASGAEAALDHPRISFSGMLARDKLDDLYASVDVVVMPSRYESFGLVAIEAMAAGAPVVALDIGGVREVVKDGATGYLVDSENDPATALAERLGRLAADPALLAVMSAAARASFEQDFTIDRMVEQAEVAYRAALEAGGGHGA